jgi:riboflavin synthase
MFTGIIETIGKISQIIIDQQNRHFIIESDISKELKIDQSVAHNGVCLTVIEKTAISHTVTAILETLLKTNVGQWKVGDVVNLERCMIANGRFDGHVVQGHVDTTAECTAKQDQGGSTLFTFTFKEPQALMVEKGSITLNGISLTLVNVQSNSFSVAIIPYTLEHTNLGQIDIGDIVNIEFDIIGKYVQKMLKV